MQKTPQLYMRGLEQDQSFTIKTKICVYALVRLVFLLSAFGKFK